MPPWWSPEVPQSANRARCLARARGALAAGALEKALRHYRSYLRRCPTDVEARRELRQVQRTIAALVDRADGLPPDQLRVAAEDAVRGIEVQQHDPWKAVERLEDLLALDPGLLPAHLKLAFAAQWAGATEVAIQALRDALTLDPNHADTLRTLGQLELQQGRAERARACFARLLRLRPGDPQARLMAELAEAAPVAAPPAHSGRGLPPGPIRILARAREGATMAEALRPFRPAPVRPPAPPVPAAPAACASSPAPQVDPARVPVAFLRPPRRGGAALRPEGGDLRRESLLLASPPERVTALPLVAPLPVGFHRVPAAPPALPRPSFAERLARFVGPDPLAAWTCLGLYVGIGLYWLAGSPLRRLLF